ncbi:copper resistance protein CopC [Actinomadura sp. BRA 177]|uniref:copper resistance CopC family protein n=1 Tax=Actinomadura sp. BRA 177 TaxID=2745202 RepID=UPI001594F1C6|nr:copper resistance protein CopC [Actinomadura sp. BRA 177]NVI92268.1 copper resistance protein CopC [Actinomadura sp. BRA 177]
MNFLKPRRPMRRLGVVAVLALVLGALTATPALAHSRLISSTPGKGKSAESVTEVKLVFSDKISLAKVVVKDAQNKTYQSGEAERSGTTVTQQLTGPLPAGSYTVAYRVVGEDGHPIESDDLTFTATGGEAAAPAPSAGAVGAEEQTGDAATANEQPLKADQAATEEDSGSGAVLWVLIIAGLLVGVGIGVGIVYRAKRRHPAATGSE